MTLTNKKRGATPSPSTYLKLLTNQLQINIKKPNELFLNEIDHNSNRKADWFQPTSLSPKITCLSPISIETVTECLWVNLCSFEGHNCFNVETSQHTKLLHIYKCCTSRVMQAIVQQNKYAPTLLFSPSLPPSPKEEHNAINAPQPSSEESTKSSSITKHRNVKQCLQPQSAYTSYTNCHRWPVVLISLGTSEGDAHTGKRGRACQEYTTSGMHTRTKPTYTSMHTNAYTDTTDTHIHTHT